MRKLLGGGQVGITLGFADNKVERVVLQNSLYGDSVAHSVTSASPPKSFKHEDRTRKELRRPGNLVRASHGACSSHSEHFATLGLSAAASRQEIKQAYRKLALQVLLLIPPFDTNRCNFLILELNFQWAISTLIRILAGPFITAVCLRVQYHPDVCKGEHCALMFKQVNDAYYVSPKPTLSVPPPILCFCIRLSSWS